MLDLFSLKGKVALLTGASRGLGKAMALGLASAGADVVMVGRTPDQDLVDQVCALGVRAKFLAFDLMNVTAIAELVKSVHDEFGHIDIWSTTRVCKNATKLSIFQRLTGTMSLT